MKFIGAILIGVLLGAIAGGGYFYKQLDEVNQALTVSKGEAQTATKAQHEQEEHLQQVKAGMAAAEDKLKQAVAARDSAEASLKQALAAKEAAEAMAKEAQDAKAAAEKALAEAKKPAGR